MRWAGVMQEMATAARKSIMHRIKARQKAAAFEKREQRIAAASKLEVQRRLAEAQICWQEDQMLEKAEEDLMSAVKAGTERLREDWKTYLVQGKIIGWDSSRHWGGSVDMRPGPAIRQMVRVWEEVQRARDSRKVKERRQEAKRGQRRRAAERKKAALESGAWT